MTSTEIFPIIIVAGGKRMFGTKVAVNYHLELKTMKLKKCYTT
jgi:hypothetical protein